MQRQKAKSQIRARSWCPLAVHFLRDSSLADVVIGPYRWDGSHEFLYGISFGAPTFLKIDFSGKTRETVYANRLSTAAFNKGGSPYV